MGGFTNAAGEAGSEEFELSGDEAPLNEGRLRARPFAFRGFLDAGEVIGLSSDSMGAGRASTGGALSDIQRLSNE